MSSLVDTNDPALRYGYLWWRGEYAVGAARHEVAFCSGNGGNEIFVFMDQPLVIAIAAAAYGREYMHSQVDDMMVRRLIPALIEDRLSS